MRLMKEPPGKQGQWFLDDDENQLIVEVGDSVQFWRIDFLDASSHSITSRFAEGNRTYELVLSK